MLVIKVWKVIEGGTSVAFACIAGDAQVVKPWQTHQNAEIRRRTARSAPTFADMARQQEGAYANEKGASQKQHCSKRSAGILGGILGGLFLN